MSVAGKWNITMDTPIGTQRFTWDLSEAGGAWKGTMDSQGGITNLGGIKVDGEKVAFETTVNSPMGAIHLAFSGAVSGNRITGTCRTMFGDNQWSGERA
jgi:hypothetical protein